MAAILELNLMSILRLGSGACGLWGNREAGETMGSRDRVEKWAIRQAAS